MARWSEELLAALSSGAAGALGVVEEGRHVVAVVLNARREDEEDAAAERWLWSSVRASISAPRRVIFCQVVRSIKERAQRWWLS